MQEQKLSFIRNDFFKLLENLDPETPPKWGKMNAQQMVEHVNGFFKVSTEKIVFPLAVPEEHLSKYKEFLLSEKQFRENTKAPAGVIGEEPLPVYCKTYDEAIDKLHKSVQEFVDYFKDDPGKKTMHPAFGPLNYEEWILLHYKHVTHHLRQFGIDC